MGPDLLERLVTILDSSVLERGWYQPHILVSVTEPDDFPEGFDLGQKVLEEGDHPLNHLLGFVAPEEWTAMGLISFGWMAHGDINDPDCQRPSLAPDRRRVRCTHLVGRDGSASSTVAAEDGFTMDEMPVGRVPDSLRRCLGVSTAPPPESTIAYWSRYWLAAVSEQVWGTERAFSWAQIARMHPAMIPARLLDQRSKVGDLPARAEDLATETTWSALRWEAVCAKQVYGFDEGSDMAAWMDDGMFARWVLAELPAASLVKRLEARLEPSVLRRVRGALREWDTVAVPGWTGEAA